MDYTIEVPLNHLRAIRCLSAQKDIRYYLNGVALTRGLIAATDGTYAGTIPMPAHTDQLPELIIPNAALDFFFKKVGRNNHPVTVTWDDARKFELRCGDALEIGEGIDGTFPDIRRVMLSNTEIGVMPQLDWGRLVAFEKAAEAMGHRKTSEHKLVLVPDGHDRSVRVLVPDYPEFNGVLQPLRSGKYADTGVTYADGTKT